MNATLVHDGELAHRRTQLQTEHPTDRRTQTSRTAPHCRARDLQQRASALHELWLRFAEERARLHAGSHPRRLAAIERALECLALGDYGYCLGCRSPVSLARLYAHPDALLCCSCARQQASSSPPAL